MEEFNTLEKCGNYSGAWDAKGMKTVILSP